MTCRLALLAAALVSLLVPATAAATATPTEINHRPSKGVEYLKGLQKESGEIPGFGGDWALTSLAAAGVAPADVNKAGKEGTDARSWYEGVVGVADLARGRTGRDRLRAGGAARLRGRDRSGPRLQTAEPDRQGRLLLPAGKPRLLRLDLQRDRVRRCWRWPDAKTTGRRSAGAAGRCSTRRSQRSKPTSTPTAAGPGKKPPATQRRWKKPPNPT